jgi:hypothetical protein
MEEIADSPDGFAVAFEAAFARFQVRVEGACAGRSDWASGIAAAIRAGLDFAAADPLAADTLTSRALGMGGDGITRHRRLHSYIAEALAAGRGERPHGADLPQLTERALAGGLTSLVAERLSAGRAAELPALAPEAIQFALTPYLGPEEAKRTAGLAGRPGRRPDR